MTEFDTDHYTVRDLFSPHFVFQFPFYQRPYRWKTEHAATLLDDILAACADPRDLDELPPYFMGSIVLVRHKDDRNALVIDGRQRLTTLAILLAVIRDMERDPKLKSGLHEMLYDEPDHFYEVSRGPRLRTKGADSDYLSRFVIDLAATVAEVPDSEIPERAARICDVAQLFRRRLSNLSDEERGRLRDFVVKYCEIVGVITADEEQGLRIFRVLNTRGMDLSQVDLIKTDLLTPLPADSQDAAIDAWENAETNLGADGMSKLLRVIYAVHARSIAPDDPKRFHENFIKVAKQRDLVALCTSELTEYADTLLQIDNREIPASDLEADPNRVIQALKWLGWDSEDWMAPAIKLLISAKGDEALTYRWLSALEAVCYSFFLRGTDKSGREARREKFGDILHDLALDRDPARPGGPLTLHDEDRRRFREALSRPLHSSFHRRALVQRIELALNKAEPHSKLDVASPEHLLPDKLPRGAAWNAFTSQQHLDHRNLLGNFALLDRTINRTVANKSFADKKAIIFRGNYRRFETVKDLRQYTDWTPAIIRERTDHFAGLLCKEWKLY